MTKMKTPKQKQSHLSNPRGERRCPVLNRIPDIDGPVEMALEELIGFVDITPPENIERVLRKAETNRNITVDELQRLYCAAYGLTGYISPRMSVSLGVPTDPYEQPEADGVSSVTIELRFG